jgi:hypothetical protein
VRAPEHLPDGREALVDVANIPEAGDDQQLPLRPPKVVPLGRAGRLSHAEQDGLVRRCPGWTRETLRVIFTLTSGRRTLYASQRALMAASGLEWRTLKRHRAALVAAGILEPRGGGHRGRTAAYWIRTGPEADAWLLEEAERQRTAAGCPICGEQPATHKPIRCPDFGRVQPSLEGM